MIGVGIAVWTIAWLIVGLGVLHMEVAGVWTGVEVIGLFLVAGLMREVFKHDA